MGLYQPSRSGKKSKKIAKQLRLKHLSKGLDQILEDLKPENRSRLTVEFDEDLPGGGQFLCAHCSRHFICQNTLDQHYHTKAHKHRLKLLKEQPYTIEESRAAAGCGSNDYYQKGLTSMTMK